MRRATRALGLGVIALVLIGTHRTTGRSGALELPRVQAAVQGIVDGYNCAWLWSGDGCFSYAAGACANQHGSFSIEGAGNDVSCSCSFNC